MTDETTTTLLEDAFPKIEPLKIDRSENNRSNVPLVHASYAADRRYRLTAHFGCHLSAQIQSLWFTDCDTFKASSGGPMLIQTANEIKVAAIMVGIATRSASIALPNLDWIDIQSARDCRHSSP